MYTINGSVFMLLGAVLTCSSRISTLHHEVFDYSVKLDVVVVTPSR